MKVVMSIVVSTEACLVLICVASMTVKGQYSYELLLLFGHSSGR